MVIIQAANIIINTDRLPGVDNKSNLFDKANKTIETPAPIATVDAAVTADTGPFVIPDAGSVVLHIAVVVFIVDSLNMPVVAIPTPVNINMANSPQFLFILFYLNKYKKIE
jgi:hypothetical protein